MTYINVYPNYRKNQINPGILGHFVEQFEGNIPNGIYMPGNPLSDEDGMRTDVLEKLREVKVPQIRWAGNFSSTYHWQDGVGPKTERPAKINYAWGGVEDNGHGTAEFIKLCRKLNAEPVIGINMGSGTPEEAMNWVEYCNGEAGSYYADLRIAHGYEEPFHVKQWCLGNETYAQWQFGHMDAEEYARQAILYAYAMRQVDPTLEFTAVGLETDPEWNFKVADALSIEAEPVAPKAGNYIDYMSAHYYPIGGNMAAYENADYETRMTLGAFFHERSELMRGAIQNGTNNAESAIKVVWDEWNPMGTPDGTEFTLEMAMWSSVILNSFIRDSAYVERANYTFFVGGNGPIQVKPDGLIVQPDFYVMKMYAEHMGKYLLDYHDNIETVTRIMPVDRRWYRAGKEEHKKREIPLLDVAATSDENGCVTIFITNLDKDSDITVTMSLKESDIRYSSVEVSTIWNEDLYATNTTNPDNVKITEDKKECQDNACEIVIKRHSINAITFRA